MTEEQNDKLTKCIKCSKVVLNNQNAIECEKCLGWIHHKCSGLSKKLFDEIVKDKTRFECKYCTNYGCGKCSKAVYPFQNAIQCDSDSCILWYHLKCTHFTLAEYVKKSLVFIQMIGFARRVHLSLFLVCQIMTSLTKIMMI